MYTLISFSGRYQKHSYLVGIKPEINKDIFEVCGMFKKYLLGSKKGQVLQDKLIIPIKNNILNKKSIFYPDLC